MRTFQNAFGDGFATTSDTITLQCTGSEEQILECPYNTYCRYSHMNAGVRCHRETGIHYS